MVIGGWTEPSDGRPSIGALHVGFYEGERLVYAGKVGSGFTERLLVDLLERLQVRRRESCPFDSVPAELQRGAHWVEPDRVYCPDLGFTKLDLALYYVSIAPQ